MKKTIIIFLSFLISSVIYSLDKPKIGLALSGGGAKGLAHIGVLRVLEQEGIKPDFIAGTSMGSVIGALYSIGYTPEQMEGIVKNQNWDTLLQDKISRRHYPIDEKNREAKYIGSFPIYGYKINLPKGLAAGQNLSLLLSDLTLSVHHIENFDHFPIPFKCIATNIVTGKEVVLDSGYLPDCLRASMSIPSILTPVKISENLLVDGGLVRNLPVSTLINMGADIVIGVDVGALLYSEEELNSLINIMNQAVSFHKAESSLEERKLCDLLILPDISSFNAASFDKAEDIILEGEKAAVEMIPEIRELSDSLYKAGYSCKILPKTKIDVESVFIKNIHVEGNFIIDDEMIIEQLDIETGKDLSIQELHEKLNDMYAEEYFERVNYRFKPYENGVILVIRVIERTENLFKFGLRYETDTKAAALFNLTFRNLLIDGSYLSWDFRLGQNSSSNFLYSFYTGFIPGLEFMFKYCGFTYDAYLYAEDVKGTGSNDYLLLGSFEYMNSKIRLELLQNISNSIGIGGGIFVNSSIFSPKVSPLITEDTETTQAGLSSFLLIDTFDKTNFPHKGFSFDSEFLAVSASVYDDSLSLNPFYRFTAFSSVRIPISKSLTFLTDFKLGDTFSTSAPPDNFYFFLGGNSYNAYERGIIPFPGAKYMQKIGECFSILNIGIQYEIWKNNYVILEAASGLVSLGDFKDLFDSELSEGIGGIRLTFGMETPIGPLEYSISGGSETEDGTQELNIGFRF